jgi:pimeloyl-ACP methyl ester carboxylesterase
MGLRHSGADQTRFTDAGGVRLAYDLSGAGEPPLVFVHGWSCDRTYFEPQLRHFAARHVVAALDLRGHGESSPASRYGTDTFAADVLAVAADVGMTHPVIVGHSFGGLVALTCAARADAVRGVVLVDPAPLLDGRGKAFFARSARAVASDHNGSWRAAFAERLFAEHDTVRRAETIARIAAAPVSVSAATWQAIVDFDGAAVLPHVRVPVLLISAGEPEPGVAERIANVTVARTGGAGHFIQLQVPDQVNAMIERFLELLLQH